SRHASGQVQHRTGHEVGDDDRTTLPELRQLPDHSAGPHATLQLWSAAVGGCRKATSPSPPRTLSRMSAPRWTRVSLWRLRRLRKTGLLLFMLMVDSFCCHCISK